MEKLELELIKKLHNTQLIQKSAFEELENVLNLPPDDFEGKYRQKKKKQKNSCANELSQPSFTPNQEHRPDNSQY